MKDKKYWASGVVVIVILGAVAWLAGNSSEGPVSSQSPSPTVAARVSPPVASKTPTPVVAMPKTYSDAIAAYEGKRIQFDMYCQATPKSLVFKNGTTIMLDNRSGDARTIKIAGVASTLAGYGWKLVTLNQPISKLPARLDIDCGSAQNVSYIQLEK